jgi:hypothetical protein
MYLWAIVIGLEWTEIVLVGGVISFTEIVATEEFLIDPKNGTTKVNDTEQFTVSGYLPGCPIAGTVV